MKAEGSWIELKSRGGLQYPSDVLVVMLKKWGFFFDGFHGPPSTGETNPSTNWST